MADYKLLDAAGVSTLVSGIKSKLLDGDKIKSSLLPSYVDDVVEVDGVFNYTSALEIETDKVVEGKYDEGAVKAGDVTSVHYDSTKGIFYLKVVNGSTTAIYLSWNHIGKDFDSSVEMGDEKIVDGITGTCIGIRETSIYKPLEPGDNNNFYGVNLETGKIYVDVNTDFTYRWGGTSLVNLTDPDEVYIPTSAEVAKASSNAAVGNLKINTPMSDLKGMTFSEVLEKMLITEKYTDPGYKHKPDDQVSSPSTPVVIGSKVEWPSVNFVWNSNILPNTGVNAEIVAGDKTLTLADNSTVAWGAADAKYTAPGAAKFKVGYSYGAGYYTIHSNLGGSKNVDVDAASGDIERTVNVTAPIYKYVKVGDKEATVTEIKGKNSNGTEVLAILGETVSFGDWDTSADTGYFEMPAGNPEIGDIIGIEIPFGNSEIEMQNFGSAWGTAKIFIMSDPYIKSVNGVNVTYRRYAYNPAIGYIPKQATRFKIKLVL